MSVPARIARPIAAAALGAAILALGLSSTPPVDPRQWDWMEGTTWYVKPAGLPLMLYDADQELALPSVTQTVYTLEGCRYGYFHGRCAVLQGGMDAPNCYQLIGSINAAGDVQLNFLLRDKDGAWVRTTATGRMMRSHGEWTMVNQVCGTSVSGSQFSLHWAPMWQVTEGDPAYEHLPFAQMSVPEFLGQCE